MTDEGTSAGAPAGPPPPALPTAPPARPWYRALDRAQWNTLLGSNLGWLFDGYETYALILGVGAALRQLLGPAQLARAPAFAGAVIGLTLLGWGVGGLAGGVLADYLGRKRMMMVAIASYSVLTGLSAFAFDWTSFALLRFLVGVAIGSEWVTGTSMMAELWPDGARGRGVGLMQAGLGMGFFAASLVWLVAAGAGPGAWRVMFLIGVLPALLTLWLRRAIPESTRWQRARAEREQAAVRVRGGGAPRPEDRAMMRFTLLALFDGRELRRRTLLASAMSLATNLGFWGISTWVPPFVASIAARAGLPGARWSGYAGLAYNAGAVGGYVALGFVADAWGRKPATLVYFAGALALIPVVFLWTTGLGLLLAAVGALGWFAAGQYTWMSAWLPELFPTRLRATGAGFVFNVPRLVAWVGPLVSGTLIATFGGFRQAAIAVGAVYVVGLLAAPWLPETRGKPLPDVV